MGILEHLKARGIEARKTGDGMFIVNGVAYSPRKVIRNFLAKPRELAKRRIVGVVDIPRKSDIRVYHVNPETAFDLAAKLGCSMSALAKLEHWAETHKSKLTA